MTEQKIEVLPKQMDFLTATSREKMYSGAVRAGKTYALCLNIAMRASRPHARELLCRKTLAALKGTTLKTLLEGDGFNPPILPPGTYTHNKADKEIKIKEGGAILYFPLVNDGSEGTQQRAGSYSGTGVNIDEATELDEADYRMLQSRASIPHPDVPMQIAMACNPGSPMHFLAKRFAPPGSGYSEPMSGCTCIATRTSDNFFLPPEYIESLEREKGTLWYRRFVEGLWCGSDGVVYDKWDREVHVRTRAIEEFREFVVGVDEGYDHPFAALLVGIDGDKRIHVCGETHQSKLVAREKVAEIQRHVARCKTGFDTVIIDPSAPDLIEEVRRVGLCVRGADNDVIPGIMRVQQRLLLRGDGQPGMTVDPSCVKLIMEMETYQWKPDRPKDEVVKKFDDGADSLRYACAYIDAGFKPMVGTAPERKQVAPTAMRFTVAQPRRDWDDDRGWKPVGYR